MSQIEIRCVDQTAMFTNLPEIFSGDVNIDTVKFTFDDSWNGYTTKTAVFYNNPKDVYPQILDVNDVAVIPSQVMTKQCKLSIGVFGTKANGDVKTSKILTYNVGKGAINSDLESTPATPDFWTQLLARQINFENNINSTVDTLETTVTTYTDSIDTLESIVKGRNQALAYNSYSEMITALNSMSADELKRGQNIYIGTVGVPDLWVYGVETTKSTYTYTNDETFVNGLNNNVTVQVGYYKLAQLETQKVDVGGINTSIEGLQSDVGTLQNNLNNLSATNVSVDDTTLALGGSNVQDTLEALKTKITNLESQLSNKVNHWTQIFSKSENLSSYQSSRSINQTVDFSAYKEIKITLSIDKYAPYLYENTYFVNDIKNTRELFLNPIREIYFSGETIYRTSITRSSTYTLSTVSFGEGNNIIGNYTLKIYAR